MIILLPLFTIAITIVLSSLPSILKELIQSEHKTRSRAAKRAWEARKAVQRRIPVNYLGQTQYYLTV